PAEVDDMEQAAETLVSAQSLILAGERSFPSGGLCARLHGFSADSHEHLRFLPADTLDPIDRHADLAAGEPISRVDHELRDGPRAVIEKEVRYVTDVVIDG